MMCVTTVYVLVAQAVWIVRVETSVRIGGTKVGVVRLEDVETAVGDIDDALVVGEFGVVVG